MFHLLPFSFFFLICSISAVASSEQELFLVLCLHSASHSRNLMLVGTLLWMSDKYPPFPPPPNDGTKKEKNDVAPATALRGNSEVLSQLNCIPIYLCLTMELHNIKV